jgi:hypothetical protein
MPWEITTRPCLLINRAMVNLDLIGRSDQQTRWLTVAAAGGSDKPVHDPSYKNGTHLLPPLASRYLLQSLIHDVTNANL